MAITGFFSKTPAKQKVESNFISVGGEQFHAVAVALIDHFKSTARVNEASLKRILERFFAYYPKFISMQPYLTPADRMEILINSSRKSEIVECIAYVLRQLVVDEIYADPLNLNYREVFSGLSPETPQNYLRQPNTVLPAKALSTALQTLGLKITLSFIEHGKELRERVIFDDQHSHFF